MKELLPTTLGSEEIRRTIAADILRRSVFSARMASATYLARIRDVCARVLAGEINQATAVKELMETLESMGHSPLDPGGLTNPASLLRLNLIVDTQTRMAASVARIDNQTEATIASWPAWELVRFETRQKPRQDWTRRWREAGNYCGWQGALQNRFIALKNSPIWAALGQGAGGFRDTLGNPYPRQIRRARTSHPASATFWQRSRATAFRRLESTYDQGDVQYQRNNRPPWRVGREGRRRGAQAAFLRRLECGRDSRALAPLAARQLEARKREPAPWAADRLSPEGRARHRVQCQREWRRGDYPGSARPRVPRCRNQAERRGGPHHPGERRGVWKAGERPCRAWMEDLQTQGQKISNGRQKWRRPEDPLLAGVIREAAAGPRAAAERR